MLPGNHSDALIIGAGMGGIHNLWVLRNLGLSVRILERAPDIGGTWWYNRYPGCMSDTESYLYRYYWDKEDLQTYPWKNHYVRQPEILEYLNHVVKKHDMRKHMQFNTEMTSATWDEDAHIWRVGTNTGETFTGRYLILALGVLFKNIWPDIGGLDSFRGLLAHSSAWDPETDLTGKRVGVIGCGSTGVQIVTDIAPKVKELRCFIRTPQYSVPSGDAPVAPEYRKWVNENYDDIIEQVWDSATGFGVKESTRPVMSVSPEEREAIFEELWTKGNGFRFMFGGFGDITFDAEANEEACRFIRKKIGQIVTDPAKAAKLMPTEKYARRPLCDGGYYASFNHAHVDIVDCKATPITEIVPEGVRTADGAVHELDVLICATGFDVVEGAYTRVDIRGRDGRLLMDEWRDGGKSYLGLTCAGFPNLFTCFGPLSPFGNFPPCIMVMAEMAELLIKEAEKAREESGGKGGVVEATEEAQLEWKAKCEALAEGSLFKTTNSWLFDKNVKGKPQTTKFFFGGLKGYKAVMNEVKESGFKGFKPFAGSPREVRL